MNDAMKGALLGAVIGIVLGAILGILFGYWASDVNDTGQMVCDKKAENQAYELDFEKYDKKNDVVVCSMRHIDTNNRLRVEITGGGLS